MVTRASAVGRYPVGRRSPPCEGGGRPRSSFAATTSCCCTRGMGTGRSRSRCMPRRSWLDSTPLQLRAPARLTCVATALASVAAAVAAPASAAFLHGGGDHQGRRQVHPPRNRSPAVELRSPGARGGSRMAVVLVHQGPDVTRERYDQVIRSMMGKDRAESASDWPVEGLLVHAAGEGPNGFRVVDVWESEEAARRFGEELAPHLQEAGITAEPEVYQAHAFVSA